MKIWSRLGGIAFALAGIGAVLALSQVSTFKKAGVAFPQRFAVNPQKIEVLKRSKLDFTPFPLRHPLTNRTIGPADFVDLPAMGSQPTEKAKRVRASVYFAELNKLEKGFNDLGYSLKSGPDEVVLQKSKIDRAALTRAANVAKVDHKAFDPATMTPPPTFSNFRGGRLSQVAVKGLMLERVPSPSYNKSFQYQAGDPDIATAFVRGGLRVNGSRTLATVQGDFAIGATLFKKSADILRMTGSMTTPGAGVMNGRVELLFLGFVIHTYKKDTSEPFTFNSDFTKEFRQQIVPISFMLGPVPMTGEVGIVGRAGVKYGISLAPLDARGLLAPYSNIGVYAEIGTGIPIVSLGVGAELILVEDRLEFVGQAQVKDVAEPQPYLLLSVSGTNVLEMLAGRLYFWIKIPVPTWKPPFWKKKKYDWDVFNWEGLKVQGVLFNESKRVNL
jgi:hypothetical protein